MPAKGTVILTEYQYFRINIVYRIIPVRVFFYNF